MKAFSEFACEDLFESLNSPVEFYMTDDTVLPTAVYGAFDIDGNKYVMAFLQSNAKNTYVMEVGKTSEKGGKVMWWRFHKPADIRKVLSTSIKFAESVMFMIGPQVKAFAVKFRPAAGKTDVAGRLIERMVKRSYVKTMVYVPIIQPNTEDGKKWYEKERFFFIAKKDQSLDGLFKGPEFNKYKGLSTEPNNIAKNGVSAEVVADIKPKKVVKASVKTAPSKKYSFGEFGIQTPDGSDELLSKLKDVKSASGSVAKPVSDPPIPLGNKANKVAAITSMPALSSMIKSLQFYGYDESKVKFGDLEYVLKDASEAEKKMLIHYGLLSKTGSIEPGAQDDWKDILKLIGNKVIVPKDSEAAIANYKDKYKEYLSPAVSSSAMKSNINPDDLVSTVGQLPVHFDGWRWEGVDEWDESSKLMNAFENMEGLQHDKIKTSIGAGSYTQMVSYSGHKYDEFNTTMRDTLKVALGDSITSYKKTNLKSDLQKGKKVMTLMKAFEKIPPVTESFWVYRGTILFKDQVDKIVPGYEYCDGAFLSTSANPKISFGSSKMRIFIPKGSRVLPIFKHSKHSGEKEILLPPSSVIKVIEVMPGQKENTIGFSGVFMGSAVKDILQKVEKLLNEQLTFDETLSIMSVVEGIVNKMNEEKKKETYDANNKFGGQYDDELAKAIADAIKKGKLKLDK